MSEQVQSSSGIVYLRLEEVKKRTGLSKSTIYNRMDPKKPGFDPSFPKQVKLGDSASGWIAAELEAWLASRLRVDGTPVHRDTPPTEMVKRSGVPRSRTEEPYPVAALNKQRAEMVRALLEKHAKRGQSLFFGDVMKQTMLSPDVPEDCKVLDEILANLSTASHIQHNVLIGALVFDECTGKRCPKKAFFDLAASLARIFHQSITSRP